MIGRVPKGLRYMVAGAFFFSVMTALVKLAGERLPSMEIVLARAVVMVVLTLAVLRRRGVSPWGRDRRRLLLRGLVGFSALSLFFYAIVELPLADVTVIYYTMPVFTGILAALLIGERLQAREVALALGSLAGVGVVFRPGFVVGVPSRLPLLAVLAGLGAAVLAAGAYVLVRHLSREEDPMVIVFYFALVTLVGALPFTALDPVMPRGVEWLILLGVGATTQIGQVFVTWGLKSERAGRAMSVGYVQIVFAALWGVILFGDVPDQWTLVGALMIVACTFGQTKAV